jgi:hypothetical protein
MQDAAVSMTPQNQPPQPRRNGGREQEKARIAITQPSDPYHPLTRPPPNPSRRTEEN